MKLHYFKSPKGISNFGDDLNPWLWEKLLPGIFDDDHETIFIGLGTLLNERLPPRSRTIVFSSGVGYGVAPKVDDSWKIYCVRGPLSARALGISEAYAVTDGAVLIRRLFSANGRKKHRFSYMPHATHASRGANSFKAICDDLGFGYIDPRWPVEEVLSSISEAECLITESMHGAIVADSFRVPWIPVKTSNGYVLDFKWQDWCSSIGVTYGPHSLLPISDADAHSNVFQSTRHWVNRGVVGTQLKSMAKHSKRYLSRKDLLDHLTLDLEERCRQLKQDVKAGMFSAGFDPAGRADTTGASCADLRDREMKKSDCRLSVVLGLSVNGLSVVRSLGRRGLRVIAMDRSRQSEFECSRYIEKFEALAPDIKEDELLARLLEFGRSQAAPVFLIPTNDFFVLFIAKHSAALSPYFTFTVASYEVMETVVNKQKLYTLAERLGVSCPKTFSPRSENELMAVLGEVSFPCFLKPAYGHVWRKRYKNVKLLKIENKDELVARFREVHALGLEVMVQEIIPGGDETIHSLVAFMGTDGQVLASVTKQKLRQYPIGAGDGCFQVTTRNEKLKDLGVQLLRGLRYVGPATIEFRWDAPRRRFVLIEINARTISAQEMIALAGLNFPYLSYCVSTGKPIELMREGRAGVKWICFEWDFFSFLEGRRMKILSTAGWLKSLWGIHSFAYLCWDDPLPFFVRTAKFMGQIFCGVLRKLFRRGAAARNIKHPALVLGFGVNGLSVVRSLGRHGIPVIAFDRYKPSGAVASRYIREFVYFSPERDEADLLERIIKIGSVYKSRVFLFPTNDYFVLFVAKNADALRRYFYFTVAEDKVLENIVNKKNLYENAERLGIPCPRTFSPRSTDDAYKISGEVRFPCFLKPALSHIWRRKYINDKVLYLENKEQLLHRFKEIRALGLEVMIQEIIPGGDDTIHTLDAFVGQGGIPLAVVTKKKIRQFPVGTGDGCFQMTTNNEEVKALGLRLLKGLDYVGPACVEFRWDARDNRYKLMEINARTIVGQELITRAGIDIPYLAYQYSLGEKVEPIDKYKVGLKWIWFESDFESFLQARKMGILTFGQWVMSIAGARAFAVFAWDDLGPFVVESGLFFKRIVAGFSKRLTTSLPKRVLFPKRKALEQAK